MAGTQAKAIPITIFQVEGSSDALPQQRRMAEAASKTFHVGVPLVLSSGYLQESGTISSATPAIIGMSSEGAHNLASAGVAPLGGSGVTYGSVPNQASAVNVPIGAPMSDGNCGVFIANNETVFQGVVDDSCTIAVANLGVIYGLTKDSTSGQWFVDTTITTTGAGACVEVLQLVDPSGTLSGKVAFRVLNAAQGLGL